VLVVEDDEELRIRLIEILSARYRVLSAGDAESALQIADKERPDLLVSDIGLPGIDGLELVRRFQALPGNRLAPALLLSAYVALENRLSGFSAGAVDYLTKPFDPEELVARVQAQLDRRSLALRLHESEKLAAIGTMTAGLAHEMRNPANALVNAVEPLAELLPEELRQPGTPVSELLSVIRDCSTQIGLLSRQLLGFRRGVEVAREDTSAVTLVERAVAILRPTLRNAELKTELDYRGTLYCAPVLILQVLSNLLDNAAHAAAAARAPGRASWVRVVTFELDGFFVCEVSDSGAGVPVPLRERIFEPFFTTKPPGEGSGLGLSTSRQIAERHQGRLYVHASDEGSAFRLELPIHARGSASAISAG
jgi:signal transduction histidine kinase